MKSNISRRDFLKTSGVIAGSSLISSNLGASSIEDIPFESNKKITVALVGTGSRGIFMWGKDLVDSYSNYIEFVGLCDINEGRVETGKRMIGVSCPTYTDFEKMMKETKPEVLIVTTMDSTHHQFIIRGMELGANVITEKPMTIDEKKIQAILDAEERTGKHCRVTFN